MNNIFFINFNIFSIKSISGDYLVLNIQETLKRYWRVLQVARKPGWKDMSEVLRIVGIGFVIIGAIGFVFYLISIIVGA